MKTYLKKLPATLALLSTINSHLSTCRAQGTAFTYQGQLQDNGAPASGIYDLKFSLLPAGSGTVPILATVTNTAVGVTNGLFTTTIDFGAQFPGADRWLGIAVRTNGATAFTGLTPRQQLTPTPYAITAGTAITAESATGLPGLTVQQNADDAPNVIGGSSVNSVAGGVEGATIGGGGAVNYQGFGNSINSVTANFGTVSGGYYNTAGGMEATVGGGEFNAAANGNATVSGGGYNIANGGFATISGGEGNTANYDGSTISGGESNTTGGEAATVGGGEGNTANDGDATVSGGGYNTASGIGATVGGGESDRANNDSATVSGGKLNTAGGVSATVGGGQSGSASGNYATVSGGYENSASSDSTTIGGGYQNKASFSAATVGGGAGNIASGFAATVPGGATNIANSPFSFAAGQQAQALHQGAFVWADSQNLVFSSTANDQFLVRAQGGVGIDTGTTVAGSLTINTNTYLDDHAIYLRGLSGADHNHGLGYNGQTITNFGTGQYQIDGPALWGKSGGVLGTRGGGDFGALVWSKSGVSVYGTFNNLSDRNAKQDFTTITPAQVLDKVARLPLSEWSYKVDAATRHIGPTAQDFYAAFNVGTDDKHIAPIDENGVALAAIQGLNQKLQRELSRQNAENTKLKQQNDSLAERLNELEVTVKQLAAQK